MIPPEFRRTDLVPAAAGTGALALVAVFALALWFCARRFFARRFAGRPAAIAASSTPFAAAAIWALLQLAARFVFLASPTPLALAAVIGALALEGTAALCAREAATMRPGAARIAVGCRTAAVAVLLVVLMAPTVVGERHRGIRRRVAVLFDVSDSMRAPDRLLADEERAVLGRVLGSEPPRDASRLELARRLVLSPGGAKELSRLAKKHGLDHFVFGAGLERAAAPTRGEEAAPAGAENLRGATDFAAALEGLSDEIPAEELAGVIVFTDGLHNGEAGAESAARRLGAAGAPVYTVTVGGTRRPFDVAIESLRAPESVFDGDRVRIVAGLVATGAKGRSFEARLFREGAETAPVATRRVEPDSDDWTGEAAFSDLPDGLGDRRYRVELEPLEGEYSVSNNSWTADVSISDERTEVLLVDRRPRWEFRYLRNLFHGRDRSVHLQSLLLEPDRVEPPAGATMPPPPPRASAARPFGESEAGDFPADEAEWRKFDVIALGDVGDADLPPGAGEIIRRAVEERGALLVLIAGPEAMPCAVHDESLRSLVPVEFVPDAVPRREAPEDEFVFSLTAAGRAHPVMRQSASSAENDEIWALIPRFTWRFETGGAKPGAEVLAVAADPSADGSAAAMTLASAMEEGGDAATAMENLRRDEGRRALVIARSAGRGRVLMLATDMMWRLRYRRGDSLHHRFWSQAVRWGAGDRLRAGNRSVRIGTDRIRYALGEPVRVTARVLDREAAGVKGLALSATLRDADGKARASVPLVEREGADGCYEGSLESLPDEGEWTVEPTFSGDPPPGVVLPAEARARIVAMRTLQPAETARAAASDAIARRIAEASGGKALSPAEFAAGGLDFGAGGKTEIERTEFRLWALPPLFALVMALLFVEWIVRRRNDLP